MSLHTTVNVDLDRALMEFISFCIQSKNSVENSAFFHESSVPDLLGWLSVQAVELIGGRTNGLFRA